MKNMILAQLGYTLGNTERPRAGRDSGADSEAVHSCTAMNGTLLQSTTYLRWHGRAAVPRQGGILSQQSKAQHTTRCRRHLGRRGCRPAPCRACGPTWRRLCRHLLCISSNTLARRVCSSPPNVISPTAFARDSVRDSPADAYSGNGRPEHGDCGAQLPTRLTVIDVWAMTQDGIHDTPYVTSTKFTPRKSLWYDTLA